MLAITLQRVVLQIMQNLESLIQGLIAYFSYDGIQEGRARLGWENDSFEITEKWLLCWSVDVWFCVFYGSIYSFC